MNISMIMISGWIDTVVVTTLIGNDNYHYDRVGHVVGMADITTTITGSR